jgi:hypothetical protein
MLNGVFDATVKYPSSFGVWAGLALQMTVGTNEIAVTGRNIGELFNEILHIFMPNRVLQISAYANEEYPLLKGKKVTDEPAIFLCKNYACQAPVDNIKSLIRLLDNLNTIS